MIEALHQALDAADLDAEVRVIVLTGAGKDFCAGADLEELLASADAAPEANEASALRLGKLFARMREMPKPVVAVVRGRALAGGAGLMTACDIVLAGAGTQVGYPEVLRGFVPAMVMTMLRRLAGEKAALDLVLTGRTLGAAEALAHGLLSRVVPDDALDREAAELTRRPRGGAGVGARDDQAALLSARRPDLRPGHRARRAGQRAGPADAGLPGCDRPVSRQDMSINRIRLALSLTGMVVAIAAIMLDDRRVVWGAVALLGASLLLRLMARRDRSGPQDGS